MSWALYFQATLVNKVWALSKAAGIRVTSSIRNPALRHFYIRASLFGAKSFICQHDSQLNRAPGIESFSRRSILGAIPTLVSIGFLNPSDACARAGEPAKVKRIEDFAADFVGCQDERTNGCRDGRTEQSVYDRESPGIIAARTDRVTSEWKRLATQVLLFLQPGVAFGALLPINGFHSIFSDPFLNFSPPCASAPSV